MYRYLSVYRLSGEVRCMPPLALSSLFYPTFEDGAAVFNGEGDQIPT